MIYLTQADMHILFIRTIMVAFSFFAYTNINKIFCKPNKDMTIDDYVNSRKQCAYIGYNINIAIVFLLYVIIDSRHALFIKCTDLGYIHWLCYCFLKVMAWETILMLIFNATSSNPNSDVYRILECIHFPAKLYGHIVKTDTRYDISTNTDIAINNNDTKKTILDESSFASKEDIICCRNAIHDTFSNMCSISNKVDDMDKKIDRMSTAATQTSVNGAFNSLSNVVVHKKRGRKSNAEKAVEKQKAGYSKEYGCEKEEYSKEQCEEGFSKEQCEEDSSHICQLDSNEVLIDSIAKK